ncbi:hypothetical protein VTO42DRAFT_7391 [Malbranchea cinnamomea]
MLPDSDPSPEHNQSPPDQNKISFPRRSRRPAEVAKKKKTFKNATRNDNETTKTETTAFIDDLSDPPTMDRPPIEPSAQAPFVIRSLAHDSYDSPVLEALGTLTGGHNDPDLQTRTGNWARSVPFGKSPPNCPTDGTSMDESPPAFTSIGERNSASPPTNPEHGKPRPLSYAGGFSPSNSSRQQSTDRQKRCSMSPQYMNQPLPPHMPQRHFYGAPDIDIGTIGQGIRAVPDSGYSFCALDVLPQSLPKSAKFDSNVLLLGFDGSLEILAFENGKSRAIGALEGLGGRVVDAKFLTWTSGKDPFAELRPLIAVTVHGPVLQGDENGDSLSGSDQVEILPGLPTKQDKLPKPGEPPQMQTRVQVYSLRTQECVATLFATKPVPIIENFLGLPSAAPSPIGNLRLYASGNHLLVASGTSGEVLVYGAVNLSSSGAFQCFGKVWTGIRPKEVRRVSSSSASTDQDDLHSDSGRTSAQVDTAILSVCGRWLAVVNPSPTRISLHGIIPSTLTQKRSYGIDAYTPPPRPSVTCAVDSGEGESLLNKVARGVTQELFRGARWLGDQGLQTWNNYWNKDSPMSQAPPHRRYQPTETHPATMLPPTHAHDNQSTGVNEPDLVSIYDLKLLEDNYDQKLYSPTPIATFQPPGGCSYLSFSPSGLMLLTSNKRGDMQYVWDLMQIQHCRARAFLSEDPSSMTTAANPPAAHVRQVAWYSRMTRSSVLDVIWTAPTGTHLAIVTKKGTVHVHGLPPSAFQWPPLRRLTAPKPAAAGETGSRDEGTEETSTGNPFSAAMKLVGGKTQPILAAVRGRAPSVGAAFAGAGGFASSAGVRSGKAVAAGLSKSVEAATNTIRHAGENRLHLANFARDPAALRVAWFGDENSPQIGVIDGGCLKVYHIRPSTMNGKQDQPVVGPKVLEIQLPAHAQFCCGSQQPALGSAESNVNGFWSVPSAVAGHSSAGSLKTLPLSQAEIETSAPYQPFHTDRRVNLKVFPLNYTDETCNSDPWAFGNDIPATKIRHRSVHSDDDDDTSPADQAIRTGDMENLVSLGSGGDDVEHIVITTRRKKRNASKENSAGGDEDGFFEDDCEVLDFARDRV